MADENRIRSRIREIASRRENVTMQEIEWVMNQLKKYCLVNRRPTRHGVLFRVEDRRFMVNGHNPGSKQVKTYSVDDFLDAMSDLGWFED